MTRIATPTAARHRWDDLPVDRPIAMLERRRVIGSHVMISRVLLQGGFFVPTHSHANEQISCVLSGAVTFGVGGEGTAERREVTVRAGEVLHLPPHVPHSARALEESLLLDVFSPPSEKTGIDAHGTQS